MKKPKKRHIRKGPHRSQFRSRAEPRSSLGTNTKLNLKHISCISKHMVWHSPKSIVLTGIES